MPRFSATVLLCFSGLLAFSSTSSTSDAQTTASTTAVIAAPTSGPYGTAVALTAGVSPSGKPATNGAGAVVLPTGTVQFFDGTTALNTTPAALTAGSGFNTSPFGTVFGSLDPAFTDVSGQLSADVNSDGLPDLLVYLNIQAGTVNQADVEVQMFLAKAGGGFTTVAAQKLVLPVPPPANTPNLFVPVLVDLNGDGKPDLLFGPSVAYGNGDGTFLQPAVLPALATGFTYTYATDVTGDGKADIIAVNLPADLTTPTVSLQMTVFVNQGAGTFQPSGPFTFGTGQCPCFLPYSALQFGDLNGDGLPDIVAQSLYSAQPGPEPPGAEQTFTSLLNLGGGNFAAAVPINYSAVFSDGNQSSLLTTTLADFNGDGKLDLALIYPDEQLLSGDNTTIIFLPGNGDGAFGTQINSTAIYPMPSQQGPFPVPASGPAVVFDSNLDGLPDLVFGTGAIALGDGKGSFSGASRVSTSASGLAESIGIFQLSESPFPSLVFAGNPGGTGAASTSYVASYNLASTASLTPQTLSAGAHSITAKYSGDSNYATSTSAPTVVNISQAAESLGVTPSANPSYAGESVSFVVALTSTATPATGTVTIANGSTTLGTGTLDATGKATIAAVLSSAGTLNLTASYSGDVNHSAVTTTFTQTVVPTFAVAAGSAGSTITVTSGKSATAQVSVTGASGYSGTVTFTCSGLPTDATCTFSPATLSVAGAVAQTSTLTVNTGASNAASLEQPFFGRGLPALGCGIFAAGLLFWPRRRRAYWMALLVVGMAIMPFGCGGNSSSNSNSTPSGSYAFKVVATSGTSQISADYTLVVQ